MQEGTKYGSTTKGTQPNKYLQYTERGETIQHGRNFGKNKITITITPKHNEDKRECIGK
jgi:hypothetical protein